MRTHPRCVAPSLRAPASSSGSFPCAWCPVTAPAWPWGRDGAPVPWGWGGPWDQPVPPRGAKGGQAHTIQNVSKTGKKGGNLSKGSIHSGNVGPQVPQRPGWQQWGCRAGGQRALSWASAPRCTHLCPPPPRRSPQHRLHPAGDRRGHWDGDMDGDEDGDGDKEGMGRGQE